MGLELYFRGFTNYVYSLVQLSKGGNMDPNDQKPNGQDDSQDSGSVDAGTDQPSDQPQTPPAEPPAEEGVPEVPPPPPAVGDDSPTESPMGGTPEEPQDTGQ